MDKAERLANRLAKLKRELTKINKAISKVTKEQDQLRAEAKKANLDSVAKTLDIPDPKGQWEVFKKLYWETPVHLNPLYHLLKKPPAISLRRAVEQRLLGFVHLGECHNCGGPLNAYSRHAHISILSEQRQGLVRQCVVCDEAFRRRIAAIQSGRGDPAMRDRIEKLRTMPYVEYLKTDHWNQLRKERLKEAQYRCELCNARGKLYVHHRTYERRGQERITDLIALCKNCHGKFHGKGE